MSVMIVSLSDLWGLFVCLFCQVSVSKHPKHVILQMAHRHRRWLVRPVGVAWRGVLLRGMACCGVARCGMVRRGVVRQPPAAAPRVFRGMLKVRSCYLLVHECGPKCLRAL